VLIDSWGFMWRLARALKLRGARARRIKLIGPQVWATRPGRARVLAKWVDHLLCIHAFEQPFYVRWGLPTTVIGNPALHRLPQGSAEAFRSAHDIAPGYRLLGLLPGSRPAEIRRVMPTLVEAASRLCASHADLRVLCVAAGSVEASVREAARSWTFPHLIVSEQADPRQSDKADVALACSGTVTTELAAQGAAVVTGYRLGWITWAILRAFLFRSRYATLVNVAAGREVIPEFMQTTFTADRLARAAGRLLSDPAALKDQRAGQRAALRAMAGPGRPAAEIAAETILRLL
jgi:lipid-A-disaccharide synthase